MGFAYQAMSKLVIRSAFGVFYNASENGPYSNPSPGFNPPYFVGETFAAPCGLPSANAVLDCSVPGLGVLSNGFPANSLVDPNTPTLFSMDPYMRTPYVMQWHFTAQYQVGQNSLIEVAYVVSKGTKLYTFEMWTRPRPRPTPARLTRRAQRGIHWSSRVIALLACQWYNRWYWEGNKRSGIVGFDGNWMKFIADGFWSFDDVADAGSEYLPNFWFFEDLKLEISSIIIKYMDKRWITTKIDEGSSSSSWTYIDKKSELNRWIRWRY